MERYNFEGDWKAKRDKSGEWVRWDDIEYFVMQAAEIAERHDRYRAALVKIAAVPLTLPNASSALAEARLALLEDNVRES